MPRKSARTPLFAALKSALEQARRLNQDTHFYERSRYTRREALKILGASSLALGIGAALPGCHAQNKVSRDKRATRVVVVGAGIAGLNCAHHLRKAGLKARIFEASNRTGGRCYSATDLLAPGLTTELGGEFLDSTHIDMLSLANELQLDVYDVKGPGEERYTEAYSFGERLHSNSQILEEFRPVAARIAEDAVHYTAWTDAPSPEILALDRISLSEYLERIGARGWLKELINVAYVTEYGIDADQQSSLNLISLISTDMSTNYFDVYGASDERFKIRGGNQRIPDRLTAQLQEQIEYGQALEAITNNGDTYKLTFQSAGTVHEVDADIVVIAIPFTMLRGVKLPDSFPAEKMRVINELGYGANSKFLLGFNSRPWRELGYSGNFFSGAQFQSGWDNSRAQGGASGGMTIFLGGKACVESGDTDAETYSNKALPWMGRLFAKCDLEFNGKTGHFHWPSYPFSKASYSVYKIGQWTTLAGLERTPVGNIFFAGEHCSEDFQGFMNGAAESGRVAAQDVVTRITQR